MIKIRRKNSEDSFSFIVEQKVRKRKKRNYEKEGDWCFGGKLNIKGYFLSKMCHISRFKMLEVIFTNKGII